MPTARTHVGWQTSCMENHTPRTRGHAPGAPTTRPSAAARFVRRQGLRGWFLGVVSPSRQAHARRVRPRPDPPLFRQFHAAQEVPLNDSGEYCGECWRRHYCPVAQSLGREVIEYVTGQLLLEPYPEASLTLAASRVGRQHLEVKGRRIPRRRSAGEPLDHSSILASHMGRDVSLNQRPQFDHQPIVRTIAAPSSIKPFPVGRRSGRVVRFLHDRRPSRM